jgi:hypothetical protein
VIEPQATTPDTEAAVPFWNKRHDDAPPAATERPAGVSRREWQEHLRDPSAPLSDPVPGLAEHAASAGWRAAASAALDESGADFAHDMLKKLNGLATTMDPHTTAGGGPNRYADSYAGAVDGRDFVLANVSFSVSHFRGGEQPLAGSLCSIKLGTLLPLALVNPRRCEPFFRALMKPVKLGRDDFDRQFDVRSGHPDYALALVSPMADLILQRDDWAFLLDFASLVSLSATPFRTVDDVTARVMLMSRLVSLIPEAVVSTYQVAVPRPAQEQSVELSPADQERGRRIVDALPPDQRRALIGRMRTEGPETVLRELLDQHGP